MTWANIIYTLFTLELAFLAVDWWISRESR
jgi:hypothetical protein